ncbi:hypothetical protein ACWJKH_15475 [Xanthomonas axonopodis pv. cassiae]|uniref:hypothetical protein n=1 Tax=Xanthomonas axonopodis TaxID=53413 RepID=UPI0035590D2C
MLEDLGFLQHGVDTLAVLRQAQTVARIGMYRLGSAIAARTSHARSHRVDRLLVEKRRRCRLHRQSHPAPCTLSSSRGLAASTAHALRKRAAAALYVSSPCASDNALLTQHRVLY